MRLDRWLTTLGMGSRSEVQRLIRSGAVAVAQRQLIDSHRGVSLERKAIELIPASANGVLSQVNRVPARSVERSALPLARHSADETLPHRSFGHGIEYYTLHNRAWSVREMEYSSDDREWR